jgi:transcriptional regulator with XRE-family HTH domain
MSQGQATARRRLGAELKRYRDEAGLTLEQAAEALECSTSKISRLENGKGLPKQRDIRDLARLYGKEAEASLEALFRLARQGARAGWWQKYTPLITAEPFVLDGADRYAALESDAASIKSFDISVFHGLLQSPAYARLIFEGLVQSFDRTEIDSLVEFRKRRQDEALARSEGPLHLREIVDQSVIARLVGGHPAVAHEQLTFVLDAIERYGVEFQILPFDAGLVRAIKSSFAVIEFEESVDQGVVFVESHAGASYLEGDFGVDIYKDVFEATSAKALSVERSRDALVEALEGARGSA